MGVNSNLYRTHVMLCLPSSPLSDTQIESDEMYQNAGEKEYKHDDTDDPPRRRANRRRGRRTMENDGPLSWE